MNRAMRARSKPCPTPTAALCGALLAASGCGQANAPPVQARTPQSIPTSAPPLAARATRAPERGCPAVVAQGASLALATSHPSSPIDATTFAQHITSLQDVAVGDARECIARLAKATRGPSISSDGRFLLWPSYEPYGMSDSGTLALHLFETEGAQTVGDFTLYTGNEMYAFQQQELPALPQLLCERGEPILELMSQSWRALREISSLGVPEADAPAPASAEVDVGCSLTFEVYAEDHGAKASLRAGPELLVQQTWSGTYPPAPDEPTCTGSIYAVGGWIDPELQFVVLSAEYSTLPDTCPSYDVQVLQRMASRTL